MEVIPVIDLKGGAIVRARAGERASYRPIETPLSATSKPLDVVAGLLALYPFRTLYVADLDAIEGRSNSNAIVNQIAKAFPRLALWVDNGCATIDAAQSFLAGIAAAPVPPLFTGEDPMPATSLVLGSESQRDTALAAALRNDSRIILSLDFRGDDFLGPAELLTNAALWPQRLIVMTLARVGTGQGPDLSRAAEIRRRAGGRALYLAGGLRGRDDLAAVRASGAAGILVASALHNGQIAPADLIALTG